VGGLLISFLRLANKGPGKIKSRGGNAKGSLKRFSLAQCFKQEMALTFSALTPSWISHHTFRLQINLNEISRLNFLRYLEFIVGGLLIFALII
jgi:hypothetical protein